MRLGHRGGVVGQVRLHAGRTARIQVLIDGSNSSIASSSLNTALNVGFRKAMLQLAARTGVRDLPGVQISYPVESNAVFARMPADVEQAMHQRGWKFYTGVVTGEEVNSRAAIAPVIGGWILSASSYPVLFGVTADAFEGGGIQPEGGPSRENNGMDFSDQVERVEQVGLPCAGRAAAHIHTAGSALPAEDDRASGQRVQVRGVADFNVGDIDNGVCHGNHKGAQKAAPLIEWMFTFRVTLPG